jgi:hypothetical protein
MQTHTDIQTYTHTLKTNTLQPKTAGGSAQGPAAQGPVFLYKKGGWARERKGALLSDRNACLG